MRLEGRTALVTGGASGIGAATCRRLSAEGARVAVCDLDLERAREVAGELDAEAFEMDVTGSSSVREALSAVKSELGDLDVLVNNAGMDEFAFFKDTDEDMWQRVIGVNLIGVMRVTHGVLPGMIARDGGRIVNVASEAGRVGSSGEAVYSAAKGGVIAFTKTIAREGARFGIYCNAVAPGPIDTPLLERLQTDLGEIGPKVREAMIAGVALKRVGQPEEVAAAVTFLGSDDASFVTGQTLGVSGGLAMV